jgi:hypothetical protein
MVVYKLPYVTVRKTRTKVIVHMRSLDPENQFTLDIITAESKDELKDWAEGIGQQVAKLKE